MGEKYIAIIYELTNAPIKAMFQNDSEIMKLYMAYLSGKYEKLLEDLLASETRETVTLAVDSFVDDELKMWRDMDKTEMCSVLIDDPAFSHLLFLSEVAFKQAEECFSEHKYYDNDEEYALRLEEVVDCLDAIKNFNISKAQEVLSETVLDIDFIFGKSESISIRLSNTI